MLERSQSLLQYYNNIASLQDWYSTDHGSHTPLQDEGDKLVMDREKGCNPDVDEPETRCEYRDPERRTSTETDSCQR